MKTKMQRIIYSSMAVETTGYDTVLDILTHAVRANKTNNITGMLVFNGTYFLQYLEGDSELLTALFNNIITDNRHYSITLIDNSAIEERVFSAWNMGYLNQSDKIQEIVSEVTGSPIFTPHQLSPDQAQTILNKLSYII